MRRKDKRSPSLSDARFATSLAAELKKHRKARLLAQNNISRDRIAPAEVTLVTLDSSGPVLTSLENKNGGDKKVEPPQIILEKTPTPTPTPPVGGDNVTPVEIIIEEKEEGEADDNDIAENEKTPVPQEPGKEVTDDMEIDDPPVTPPEPSPKPANTLQVSSSDITPPSQPMASLLQAGPLPPGLDPNEPFEEDIESPVILKKKKKLPSRKSIKELPMPPGIMPEDVTSPDPDRDLAPVQPAFEPKKRPKIIHRMPAVTRTSPGWGERCVEVFDIISQIGEGTYGQVYKARDKDSSKYIMGF